MAMTAKEMVAWERFQEEERKREEVTAARDAKHESKDFRVYCGGPSEGAKVGKEGSHGWNIGDIDFDADGSIFIRNPYLADAIESCLLKNYKRWQEWKNPGTNRPMTEGSAVKEPPPKTEPFLFRLTRDEGWSGEKQNMVC
jgi:hypothetical protein